MFAEESTTSDIAPMDTENEDSKEEPLKEYLPTPLPTITNALNFNEENSRELYLVSSTIESHKASGLTLNTLKV